MSPTLLAAALVTAPLLVHEAVHPVSPRHLIVRVDGPAPTADPGDWTLSGGQGETAVHPAGVAVKRKAAALDPDGGWPYPSTPEYEVVLELAPDADRWWGRTLEWSTGGRRWELPAQCCQWTPAIKHNQVGYLPGAPGRYAYAGWWTGDLAPLRLTPEERVFEVHDDASGATVLQGELTLRLAHDQGTEDAYGSNYSLADVYEADLTPLDTPGTYYLSWPGVGRSASFRIADDVYDTSFATSFRSLYHQRCGTALEASLTRWTHEACHVAPVVLTDWDLHAQGDAFVELPAYATGEQRDATGGYHDAGDYDRRIQHLAVVDALVDLYELFPERFSRDDLGLPESGNGLPDVLDEAVWALGLYARLQDESGGVRGGVETTGHPGWSIRPEDDRDTTWYAFAADPRSSYRFAGAAAKLARALADRDAEASAAWLERAERAWAWAEGHRPDGDLHFVDAYAAAELLGTTGAAGYDDAFARTGPFSDGDLGFSLQDWDPDDVLPALWGYVRAEAASPDLTQAARRVLLERADAWVRVAQGTGHRFVKHPYALVAFGSLTTPHGAGLLYRVHALTGREEYLAWGAHTCDGTLGANALGRSWVTGLGTFRATDPLHVPSMTDDVAEPVPGITVYGPARYEESQGILGAALAAYDPPVERWPMAERWVDIAYVPVYSEFTVHESLAPTVFAFGYLARLEGPEPPPVPGLDRPDTGLPAPGEDADAALPTPGEDADAAVPAPGGDADTGAPSLGGRPLSRDGCACGTAGRPGPWWIWLAFATRR